jgi:hypothetical protein
MVSATQQTFRIRRRKSRRAGVKSKRFSRAHGTPAFPIHPEGRPSAAAAASADAEKKK